MRMFTALSLCALLVSACSQPITHVTAADGYADAVNPQYSEIATKLDGKLEDFAVHEKSLKTLDSESEYEASIDDFIDQSSPWDLGILQRRCEIMAEKQPPIFCSDVRLFYRHTP